MLSNRGLQILEKIIEKNKQPVTAKELSLYLGVSERSVKTYIKEVSDFCNKNNMCFESKPGKGFIADFTNEEIENIFNLKKNELVRNSQKYRISYILFILLSGWDTYTLSLFAEELDVSKKTISDDLDIISGKILKYGMRINRIAGKGISLSGSEFAIRKALKEYCVYPIGKHKIDRVHDFRLDVEREKLCINNFGTDNFLAALEICKDVEEKLGMAYTDYSFKMLVHYMSITLFRLRQNSNIAENIPGYNEKLLSDEALQIITDTIADKAGFQPDSYEKSWLDILFASAQIQSLRTDFDYISSKSSVSDVSGICDDMLVYLSEIFSNIDMSETDLLGTSIRLFLPASLNRTKFGIEVDNPFFNDVKEMYSGVFATSFTITRFYERYYNCAPSEQEISFLALYIGGAIKRNTKNVKAVLIGTSGVAAARIVARKIENKIEDIKIMAVLSSERIDELDDLEFDLILSMLPDFEYTNKVLHITPVVSNEDIKNINAACFEAVTNPSVNKNRNILSSLINKDNIIFVEEKVTKNEALQNACNRLYENGYVAENFFEDVMYRESVSSTALGNGVAIPHGTVSNVVRPVVCIIRLFYPIEWGNESVDTVFLMALNFDNISITKVFFSDFARMLSSDEKVKMIRGTKNVREMEYAIKNDLHWN